MILLDRPVVVTGTPRSGKSLVAKILRESPDFLFLSEPLSIWNIGLGRRDDDRVAADAVTPRIAERIRKACQDRVLAAGRQRYLDDLAYHALRIPFLHKVMPEARIIHTIRSGDDALPELLFGWTYKDTVTRAFVRRRRNLKLSTLPRLGAQFAKNYILSRVRGRRATWGPRVPGLAEFAASHSPAEVAAFQWRSMVEIAMADLQKLPPDQVLEVRLDELLGDPRKQMERVSCFCEISDVDHVSERAGQIVEPDRAFESKVWPGADDWEAVRAIVDPLQRRLGYSHDTPATRATPAR